MTLACFLLILQILPLFFGILRFPPFVKDKGKDVNSDWFADQWDERSVLGHARVNKRRMKGDDPEIDLRKLQSASFSFHFIYILYI